MKKKLALIIVLKRRNRNSVFRKKANHIIAGELGISAYLFSKLLKELIADGYIVEQGNYYRIIKFKQIVKEFFYETDLYVGKFSLLKQPSLSYHEVLNKLNSQLIITNIVERQKYLTNKKKDLLSENCRTVLNSNRFFRKKRFDSRCVDEITDSIDPIVRVSCRLVAKKLNISIAKANEILNTSEMFSREILFKIVKTIRDGKLEFLQAKYPKAIVIPHYKNDEYKICFGSAIISI